MLKKMCNLAISFIEFKNLLIMMFIVFYFQIKKLVYVYLMRYAEEQQDLALLSISTFQRALKVSDY